MIQFALVFLGAGTGGMVRFLFQLLFNRLVPPFPIGTILVNLLGCLLIGIIAGFTDLRLVSKYWNIFLVTGILGGFTTFSAFSLETIKLLQKDTILLALANVLVSIIGGLALTYLAYRGVKFFVGG